MRRDRIGRRRNKNKNNENKKILSFAHILRIRFCQKRLIILPNNFGFPPDKVLKKAITNLTELKQTNTLDTKFMKKGSRQKNECFTVKLTVRRGGLTVGKCENFDPFFSIEI